jgi:outer membrane usher protein
MAKRPRRTSRWSTALAEALLLQIACASAGHAADSAAAAGGADEGAVFDGGDRTVGDGSEDLYLEVTLNGTSSGLARFGYRDGALWAGTASLQRLGFVLPPGTGNPVRLDGLPGVHAQYDAQRQSVTIEAPLSLLNTPTTVLNQVERRVPKATTSAGLLLNYDIFGTQGEHGASNLSSFTELRAFNSAGVLSTTSISQLTHDNANGWQNDLTRLDTTWSMSFPDEMLTLRAGDTLTGAAPWSRSTRIAGVQLARNFALQPYLITAPMPAFLGSATLPSDVELYINGMRQYSGKVPSGPFQLNTVPSINGAGNAQVVLTDALGRTTTLNFSLYDTHQLLAQGLSDWSADLGVVRKNYGTSSFDYGHDPAASGTWRYGVTNNFTAEAHAEATNGLANAGVGGNWLLGDAGVVSGAVAHSSNRSLSGSLLQLGYDWRAERLNFSVGGTRSFGDYRDVASLYGAPPPRVSAHAVAGYSSDVAGSFSLGYVHLRSVGQAATRYASASWFKSIGSSASLNFSVNQNLDQHSDRNLFLGFTVALDRHTSLGGGVQRDGGHTSAVLDASSPAPNAGGFGWRADVRSGESSGGQAEANYLGRYGRVALGASAFGDSRFVYGEASGALVLMGGHLFAARHIDDAFAVISTDGIAAVPVLLENRPIGTTDGDGMLLVTPLNAYQENKVSIDPMRLPADVRIERVKTVTTPGDRAGAMVRFGITPVRAASVVLVDAQDKPLPLGSEVSVHGQDGEPALVGFDGVVYLDTLQAHNVLDVNTPAGVCHAEFDYRKQGDGIPQIGPLPCRRGQP